MDITGLGRVADFATGLVDRFFPPEATPEQKMEAAKALTSEITGRDKAKSAIIVAEMQQSDNYTKRARPTVVYAGLVFICINHVLFPIIGRILAIFAEPSQAVMLSELIQPVALPTAFWTAWGGIVSTWVLGRSMEKRKVTGNVGKVVSLITGNRSLSDTP